MPKRSRFSGASDAPVDEGAATMASNPLMIPLLRLVADAFPPETLVEEQRVADLGGVVCGDAWRRIVENRRRGQRMQSMCDKRVARRAGG